MKRYVIAGLLLAAAAAAGAAMYTAYASDLEYARLIAVGDEALAADQPYQALEAYSGAVAIRPDSMLAHLKRGMIYRAQGEHDQALKDLRRAVDLDPTATRPAEELANTLFSLERYEQAAARYQTYLTLDDRSPQVWYKLALARYRAGQILAAFEPVERALALDQRMAEAHLLLGLCERDRGRTSAARTSLEAAIRLAPALTAPREALADLYLSTGESVRAIDQLEALAAIDPLQPSRLMALGLAHARARRYDAALLALNRAVERFPDETAVYAALGRVWLEAGEVREDEGAVRNAIAALTTAASHPDASSGALADLGRASLLVGDVAGAERALGQAVDRLPVAPEAHLQLADLARRSGRVQQARDSLIRYATLIGDGEPLATIATQIASDSIRLGEPEVALRWINRAVDDAGSTPTLTALRRRAEAARAAH